MIPCFQCNAIAKQSNVTLTSASDTLSNCITYKLGRTWFSFHSQSKIIIEYAFIFQSFINELKDGALSTLHELFKMVLQDV